LASSCRGAATKNREEKEEEEEEEKDVEEDEEDEAEREADAFVAPKSPPLPPWRSESLSAPTEGGIDGG
jgi:hypothetical protein